MPDQEQEYLYDLVLSHASEDKDWREMLAEGLRDRGVRVWVDRWELKAGDKSFMRLTPRARY